MDGWENKMKTKANKKSVKIVLDRQKYSQWENVRVIKESRQIPLIKYSLLKEFN